MVEDGRMQQLEDEVKLLKNEIKHVLTDIEEYILNARNPFNAAVAVDVPNLGVVINQPGQQGPKVAAPTQEQDAPKRDNGAEHVMADSESQTPAQNGRDRASEVDSEGGASPSSREDGTSPLAQRSESATPVEVASGPSVIETSQVRPMSAGLRSSEHSMANALDLETIIALSQWVRSATEKIGAKRLKVLLEICYSARYLSEQSREVILGLISLSAPHKRGPEGLAPMRSCMAILAQLCNILQQEHNVSPSVLSLIFDLAEE